MESDSTTIMGRSRTPASDAGVDEDDYSVLNLDVIARAMKDLKARRASLGEDSGAQTGGDADATALVQTAFLEQSARRVDIEGFGSKGLATPSHTHTHTPCPHSSDDDNMRRCLLLLSVFPLVPLSLLSSRKPTRAGWPGVSPLYYKQA